MKLIQRATDPLLETDMRGRGGGTDLLFCPHRVHHSKVKKVGVWRFDLPKQRKDIVSFKQKRIYWRSV